MSTQSIGSATAPPLKISGLGSGLKTEEIISALMGVERRPVLRMTEEEAIQATQKRALQSLQSSLQQLSFSASELSSPTLFQTSQSVTSSEPSKVGATVGTGAGVGGYEVNVTQLANSAQRTFTFKSPEAEDTITIDGHEVHLAAGASIKELVNAINSNSEATVYAAAVNSETLVLSDRETGNHGSSFIEVSDPGGTLVEQEGKAREGQNAEYTIDGVAGTSTSNTLSEAIPGVTLTLNAVTTVSGPVTIDVSPPEANRSAIKSQVQAFVKQYNSVVEAVERETSTKPPAELQAAAESGEGTLFGDTELTGMLNAMRQAIYTPVEGLPAEMSSLEGIGVSTGAASGSSHYSQSAVEGKLTIDEAKLEEALKTNPEGVEKMLQSWGSKFEKLVGAYAEPGGTLEARISSDESNVTYIAGQITALNEMLAIRQQNLEAQYVALETVISQAKTQGSWLSGQIAALPSTSSSSSSTATGG